MYFWKIVNTQSNGVDISKFQAQDCLHFKHSNAFTALNASNLAL